MIKVTVIGAGNVAYHISKTLNDADGVILNQIYSRNLLSYHFDDITSEKIQSLEDFKESDVYIISVSDNAVAEISSRLPLQNKLVVHTAGSVPLDATDAKNRRGVFYPLQTFSKDKLVDFSAIPICLEAEFQEDLEILLHLASILTKSVNIINSEQRKAIHLAACFANNFTNHLFYIAQAIAEEKNVPFELLQPLIRETVDKLNFLTPFEAQTGPAKRNDMNTLNNHMALLQKDVYKNLYKWLSQSIIETYEREKL